MSKGHNFDHSKMKVHYETLGEIFRDLEEIYGVEVPLHTGGVGYEENLRFSLDVGLSRKRLQVQIYRLESGRYEYNGYIL